MANSTKTSKARSLQKAKASRENGLLDVFVLVLQRGARQAEGSFRANSLFSKTFSFGRRPTCSLGIPFASLPDRVPLLRSSRRGVFLLLDPRYSGTVNDGHRVGTVSEFISPRGSLLHMGSVLEPLKVPLDKGSRVSLEFGDFEILIKVKLPSRKGEAPFRGIGSREHARGGRLSIPTWNDPIEKWVPVLGFGFGALLFAPFVLFLLKSPLEQASGLLDLPFDYAREFVHPKHYSILPYVFREEMDGQDLNRLSLIWVSELQKRWSQSSRPHQSDIAMIGSFPVISVEPPEIEQLEKKARDAFVQMYRARELSKSRLTNESQRFLAVLGDFSNIFTQVSGDREGSLYVRMVNRLLIMERLFLSIRSQEESEQELLKKMFDREKIKYEPFQMPTMGTFVGARPSEEFKKDFDRRLRAQDYAQDAETTVLRKKLLNWAASDNDTEGLGTLWLDREGFVAPSFLVGRISLAASSGDSLWRNTEYAAGVKQVPPPPRPDPIINLLDVDLLVFAKREELRACYESGLRRNDSLRGVVNWEMKVSVSGSLEGLRVLRSDIKDREFLLCLQERIRSWRFPRPKNGTVTFDYPFRFQKSKKNESQ